MAAPETAPESPDAAGAGAARAEGGADTEARAFGGTVAADDEASLWLVMVRDTAAVSALLTLFGAAETWAAVSGLAIAALVSTIDGLLIGAAVAAVAHEWGHFAGARLGGGHAPLKPVGRFFPIFDYDYAHNDARAFDWMSIGGNLAHWGTVLLFLVAVPLGTSGAAALVAGAIGFSVFSSAVEFPVIRRSREGLSGIEALRTIPRDFVKRNMPLALGSAAIAFLIL